MSEQLQIPGTGANRRRLRKGMYLLPSMFTGGNIFLGFYAISQAIQGTISDYNHFDVAAKLIGVAVLLDGLDGRIARMTNTTSDFGRELDSLADAITFGVAPAVLAWMWGFHLLPPMADPEIRMNLLRFGWLACFVFLTAGVARLARFNIQANPQPSNPGRPGRKYFVGMPIPAGAGIVAAVVHLARGAPIGSSLWGPWWLGALWLLLLFAISFLMVSTWRFYSFKDIDFRSRRPFRVVIFMGLLIASIYFYSNYSLFFIAIAYMLSGVLARLFYVLRRKGSPPPTYTEAPEAR
ncbi:MAG TPA: CDP-diacylglycerol--serine O-phosphatidyltransferase [Terriglobales bacterium]|nr:CDP-diacylglycerol--serine O-phosphatidyltransferase [Terriglobales bacterium]